jgi:hypothetical protein
MARGWESKSVEAQMELAESRRRDSERARLSQEALNRQRERESLQLSRTRVMRDLISAKSGHYRESLEAALNYLDKKIAALG